MSSRGHSQPHHGTHEFRTGAFWDCSISDQTVALAPFLRHVGWNSANLYVKFLHRGGIFERLLE